MVVYKIHGAIKALEEIEKAPDKAGWDKNYLYHSLLGEIHTGTDKAAAQASFEKAIGLTQSGAEKKLLNKKIAAL